MDKRAGNCTTNKGDLVMDSIQIRRLLSEEQLPMSLLLLADLSKDMVESHIHRGHCFVAESNGEIVGVYVLIDTRPLTVELVNVAVLHSGENNTYMAETETAKYVLRRYRPSRFTLNQVRAEVAWIDGLSEFIKIPRLNKNRFGDPVSVSDDDHRYIYTVSEFIEGDLIRNPTEADYYKLGRLMHALHLNSDQRLCRSCTFAT
nr:phosphotransferase [Bacilli bacterium]